MVVDIAIISFLCLPGLSGGKRMSRLFSHRDEPCHFMMENTKQILALFMLVHYLCQLSFCFLKPDVQGFNDGVFVIVPASIAIGLTLDLFHLHLSHLEPFNSLYSRASCELHDYILYLR